MWCSACGRVGAWALSALSGRQRSRPPRVRSRDLWLARVPETSRLPRSLTAARCGRSLAPAELAHSRRPLRSLSHARSRPQSLLAVGQIVGRPASGFVLDKVGRFNGAIATTLVAAVSCLGVWLVADSFAVLAVAALLQGASSGVFWSTCQALLTDLVGIRDMASALSMLWLSIVAPATVSAPIAVWLTDYSRRSLALAGTAAFRYGIVFAGLAFVAAAVSLYGTKRYLQGDWRVFRKF